MSELIEEERAGEFAYRGWLVSIELTGTGETLAGRAELRHMGVYKCRLVLATSHRDATEARLALETKAKDFIDQWSQRPHDDETAFQEL